MWVSARPSKALLIVREMLERRKIKRFAVICLPHLCEQWQAEIRAKLDIEAVIIRSNTQARLDRQIHGDTSVYDYYTPTRSSASTSSSPMSGAMCSSSSARNWSSSTRPTPVPGLRVHRPASSSATTWSAASRPSRTSTWYCSLATPHSGKSDEFQSLLGLLKPEFEPVDLPAATQAQRRRTGAALRATQARRRGEVARRRHAIPRSRCV